VRNHLSGRNELLVKCMEVNDRASSIAICPGKILNMNTDCTPVGGVVTCMQDMQVTRDSQENVSKPDFLILVIDSEVALEQMCLPCK
jgi:hypothetical protein